MRPDFWKTTAKKRLLIPAWPWLDPASDSEGRGRVRETLFGYWTQRLGRVPDDFLDSALQDRAKALFSEESVPRWGGVGYDRILDALEGDPTAFWFFDLGSPAWNVTLDRIHVVASDAFESGDLEAFQAIRSTWRDQGPSVALDRARSLLAERGEEDAPLALSALVPLMLWQAKDPDRAMAALDRAVSAFPRRHRAALFPSLPLTYALLHGLGGDLEMAQAILTRDTEEGREFLPADTVNSEIMYHRARYLWALGRDTEALEQLEAALKEQPQHALRLFTDPSWRDPENPRDRDRQIDDKIDGLVREGQDGAVRWSQSEQPAVVRELAEAANLDAVLASGYEDKYTALVTCSLLDRIHSWKSGQGRSSPYFRSTYDRLVRFAEALPGDLPLRLGEGFQPHFHGSAPSDVHRIKELQDVGLGAQAEAYMNRVMEELPLALKLAVSTYAQRVMNAIAGSVNVLARRASPEDEQRILGLMELSDECLDLIEPVQNLSMGVTPEMAKEVRSIWKSIQRITTQWSDLQHHSFGHLTVAGPDERLAIPADEFKAMVVQVRDSAGEGVVGVPVLWRIRHGPGRPKESSEVLTSEMAVTLQGGVAYLPIQAGGRLGNGEVEVWVLGGKEKAQASYAVVSAEDALAEAGEGAS